MRTRSIVFSALVLSLLAIPVAAEDVVYFTNGTTMPIRGYRISGDMLHVDLGGNGFMAFPTYMIERIDEGGSNQRLDPSTRRPGSSSNRMVAASRAADGGKPSVTRDARVKLYNPGVSKSAPVERDRFGNAVETPLAGRGRAAEMLKVVARGNRGVSNGDQEGGLRGAQAAGANRYVIDSGTQDALKREIIGVERRLGIGSGNVAPPRPEPKPDSQP